MLSRSCVPFSQEFPAARVSLFPLALAAVYFSGCATSTPAVSPTSIAARAGSGRPATVSLGPRSGNPAMTSSPISAVSYLPELNFGDASFTTAAMIDRVVARHRQQQAELDRNRLRGASAKKRGALAHAGRSRKGQALPDAGHLAANGSGAAGDACASAMARPASHAGMRGSASARRGCFLAATAPADAPDMAMVQRTSWRQGDVWNAVRGGLVLPGVQHEWLDAYLEQLRQRPGSVDFLLARAEPYLPYLLDEIRRQRLPNDIVFVPMVESAFQTTAVSNKQAAGLWQFIASTGQRYGLQLTEDYDGRFDTHPATQAALKYLSHLNRLFNGDWLLSFAAYNAGEGAVQRAIQANRQAGGSGTFWELELPAETRQYVVRIVTLSKVVANPAAYGFKPRHASPRNTLARIETRPDVTVAELIARSGIAPDEFYRLNPAYKPDVEPPVQARNFLLPLEQAEILMAANLPGAKVFAPRKVVVKKGETLTAIARRHGIPEMKLAEWNGLSPSAPLKPGQEILVLGV